MAAALKESFAQSAGPTGQTVRFPPSMLVRRVQRVAANRPDFLHSRPDHQHDRYDLHGPVRGVGVLEGAVQTLIEQIPAVQQAEVAATLIELLTERPNAHRLPGSEG